MIRLREHPIGFCLNCRECTQQPGTAPGQCVQHDGMAELVRKIEVADAFILASPTNFSSATALFKRFIIFRIEQVLQVALGDGKDE